MVKKMFWRIQFDRRHAILIHNESHSILVTRISLQLAQAI